MRRTNGDAHRAADVSQIVFTALARDAARLAHHPVLIAWLHVATRNAAASIMIAEKRRRLREQETDLVEEGTAHGTRANWEQLRSVLDDAIDELTDKDRHAVLLRFFDGRNFAAIGAVLRMSEDGARHRVERALDKLHVILARRGITSTSAALGVLLANQPAVAVPVGLAATLATTVASNAVSASSLGFAILNTMTAKKITGGAIVAACLAIGAALYEAKVARQATAAQATLERELNTLRATTSRSAGAPGTSLESARTVETKPAPNVNSPRNNALVDNPGDSPPSPGVPYAELRRIKSLQTKARVVTDFGPLFVKLGLTETQATELVKILADGVDAHEDLAQAAREARAHGQPFPNATLREQARSVNAAGEARVRAFLGESRYQTYLEYGPTIRVRGVAGDLAARLYYSNEPLSASQADQLVAVLVRSTSGSKREIDWEVAVTSAADVLSPGQLSALRDLQRRKEADAQGEALNRALEAVVEAQRSHPSPVGP